MVMNSPLYQYGAFGEGASLFVAVVIGLFFGFFLERGGLGNPHKLTGVFYFTDFTVPKVMFTAMLVAAVGIYLLSDLALLDISKMWIVPTFFWPQIVGGFVFGIGFVLSGYCPGTSVAALASGRLDALFAMAGMGAGSLLFAIFYPSVEGFYLSSDMDGLTIQKAMGLSHWTVLAALCVIAVVMFAFMERHERRE
jgi:uncharacterized membrane protein YedE/YeeE